MIESPDELQQLQIAWSITTVAEVSSVSDRFIFNYIEEEKLPAAPGVYVFFVTYEKSYSRELTAGYVGQSTNMRSRIAKYGRSGATVNSTEGRVVAHLQAALARVTHSRSTLASASLSYVNYACFDASRVWQPEIEADRLAVESAILVHGAANLGISMANVAVLARKQRKGRRPS